MNAEDPHHCHCFKIVKNLIPEFKEKLESLGFEYKLQEDHGQVFGLIKTNGDDKQIHIKVMPTGQIEAEIEPSHDYPFAHINPEHSYSAHREIQAILRHFGIFHTKNWSIPLSCAKPIIKDPFKPTHIKTIVGLVFAVALFVGIIIVFAKSSKA